MKFRLTTIALSTLFALSSPVHADGHMSAGHASKADINYPSEHVIMPESYARTVAAEAYLWGWPMVNQLNRRAGITSAPYPGRLNGVLPVANQGEIGMLSDYINPDQSFVTCPNQDVVYGLGYFALDSEPVIIQVPDFGDRFWVYAIYDQRSSQFGHVGKQYDTEPGFYLMVGPNWEGEKPEGVKNVIRAPSELANMIPRVFMDDTDADREAIQPVIDQVVVYPLSEFTGEMKTIDRSEAPNVPGPVSDGESKWVDPTTYFDQLGTVLDTLAPLPGEEALYAKYKNLLAVAERHPEIKEAIVDEAVKTEEEVISQFFRWKHNGIPAGNGWNRSKNNAEWGYDYYNRVGTAKSNMFDNRPNETQYFYTDFDSESVQLNGENNYEITFAAGELPPVNGFWSMTLYDDRHMFYKNDLNRYSLGTKNKSLQKNEDGSLTIYAGNTSPGADKESNWLPAPNDTFSLYIRAYWGQEPILDGSWEPPVITKTN